MIRMYVGQNNKQATNNSAIKLNYQMLYFVQNKVAIHVRGILYIL